jgi:hypothetical protein
MRKKRDIADLTDISGLHRSAADAVAHAINSLVRTLAQRRYWVRPGSQLELEMRRDMPYVIHDTNFPGTQILVNREYKPVGSNVPYLGAWSRYEDLPNLHAHLSPGEIASAVHPGHDSALFEDGDGPWVGRRQAGAYLDRLRRLHNVLTFQQRGRSTPSTSSRATPDLDHQALIGAAAFQPLQTHGTATGG